MDGRLRQVVQELLEGHEARGAAEDVVADLRLDVDHQGVEELEGLGLVLDERVALAVGTQADGVAQRIHPVEVLLPQAVDGIEDGVALDVGQGVGALEAHLQLVGLADGLGQEVQQRELGLAQAVEHRTLHRGDLAGARGLEDLLLGHAQREVQVDPVGQAADVPVARVGLGMGELLDLLQHDLLHDVHESVADVVGMDDVVAEAVHDLALLVHHVVVLERALALLEVVALDALLGGLDGAVEQRVLELLALLEAHALHDLGDALGTEEAHEVVFERDEEVRRTRVALARAAAAQLAVDAARLVALGAQHVQAAQLGDPGAQFDVGAAPGHVGGDGDRALLPGAGHDLGLLLVVLGVEHRVDDALLLEHAAEHFAGLDGDGAHQDGPALRMELLQLLEHRVELLAAGLVDRVVGVLADVGPVGGDGEHPQLVDVEELLGLGLGRAGHAGQLGVEAEVVLDGDGGQRLGLALDLDVLLGLDRLVQAFAPATAGHEAAGVLVDDDDLVVLHDVLHVALVEAVGLEQLAQGVDDAGLLLELGLQRAFGFHAALGVELRRGVDLVVQRGQVGQHEGVGVVRAEVGAPLLGEVGLVGLLLDGEEELLFLGVELLLGLVGQQQGLVALHELLVAGLLEEAHEALGARLAQLDAVEQHADLLLEVGGVLRRDAVLRAQLRDERLGFAQEAVAELLLGLDQALHGRLELHELLVHRDDRRARDDERGAGFVDEDGVDLVDDGEVVAALDLLLLAGGHAIVAQVVEAELGVGAVGDVALVHLTADRGGLVVQDAADGEAQELVDVAHPLGVAGGQVVVDRDHVHAAPGQGVEVHGQGADQGLALAGGHFGDAAQVKAHAADELDVEGHHFPAERVATDLDLGAAEATAGVLHHREGLGHEGLEFALEFVVVLDGRQLGLPSGGLLAEHRLGLRLQLLLDLVDPGNEGAEAFDLTVVAGPEYLTENQTDHGCLKLKNRQAK